MERHVLLSRPRKDGSTLSSHLEHLLEATGIWPEEYEPIPPPDGTEFVWEVYWELRNTAPSGFNGPVRLCFGDFDAWQRVRGVHLSNVVIDMLLQMDAVYISEWYKEQQASVKAASPKNKTRTPRRVIRRGR